MTPPGTFDRIYVAIRQRLRDGLYRPGDRLEPALLADELNASVTPVRDALHRLTGERLVEAPRHEGFRVPMLTEAVLRHLYSWHRDLLLLAVMGHRSGILGEPLEMDEGSAEYQRQNALFLTFARSVANPELAAALESLTHRLEPVQRVEQMFLDGTAEETEEIVRVLRGHEWSALRRSLVQYHRRREKIVAELLALLLSERR